MDGFRDPSGATRAAVIALYLYMILGLLAVVLRLLFPPDPLEVGLADLAAIAHFLVLIGCFVLVGRWIYRTNANAHLFSGDISITPGWAIGWFFVPFANLIKPYEGVWQTWWASHDAAGLQQEAETSMLRWWWGLWLVTNILATTSGRFAGLSDDPPDFTLYIDLLVAVLNLPLCLVLIRLMQRLTRAQLAAFHRGTFA
jgi:hypothetical protein